ncbi:MAG TPA: GNAT family N-acetyltransferase, partial [Acidimicrobiales bacterium]
MVAVVAPSGESAGFCEGTSGSMPAMEPFEIVVDDLLIRPWRPEDADAVYRACQDPEVQRWTSIPSPYGREHAAGFVTRHTAEAWATGSAAPLGVFDAATGELLGSNGL